MSHSFRPTLRFLPLRARQRSAYPSSSLASSISPNPAQPPPPPSLSFPLYRPPPPSQEHIQAEKLTSQFWKDSKRLDGRNIQTRLKRFEEDVRELDLKVKQVDKVKVTEVCRRRFSSSIGSWKILMRLRRISTTFFLLQEHTAHLPPLTEHDLERFYTALLLSSGQSQAESLPQIEAPTTHKRLLADPRERREIISSLADRLESLLDEIKVDVPTSTLTQSPSFQPNSTELQVSDTSQTTSIAWPRTLSTSHKTLFLLSSLHQTLSSGKTSGDTSLPVSLGLVANTEWKMLFDDFVSFCIEFQRPIREHGFF